PDRADIARELYSEAGVSRAHRRYIANTSFGEFDLAAHLGNILKLRPGMRVVDVGCGSGGHVSSFRNAVSLGGMAVGFDLAAAAVAATMRFGIPAAVADAAHLPVADGFADAVACTFAIYYHPRLTDCLHEFRRIMR